MRILYGVVGEGMGHAMRSRVVLDHLFAQGHDVEIIASGRAADFLDKRFGPKSEHHGADVNRIHGLHIVYEENQVKRGATLWSNVLAGTAAIRWPVAGPSTSSVAPSAAGSQRPSMQLRWDPAM